MPHINKESLVASINEVMTNLDPKVIAGACSCFRSRVEVVVAAKSNFIK